MVTRQKEVDSLFWGDWHSIRLKEEPAAIMAHYNGDMEGRLD